MSDAKTVQTTMWFMILAQTIGSVDMPGRGERKMPSPRAYVAILVTWTTLGMIAETQQSKFAARMSVALVITGAIVGPFGQRIASFFNSVGNLYATSATPGTNPVAAAAAPVGSGTAAVASTVPPVADSAWAGLLSALGG